MGLQSTTGYLMTGEQVRSQETTGTYPYQRRLVLIQLQLVTRSYYWKASTHRQRVPLTEMHDASCPQVVMPTHDATTNYSVKDRIKKDMSITILLRQQARLYIMQYKSCRPLINGTTRYPSEQQIKSAQN
jgi:hypothetical protein